MSGGIGVVCAETGRYSMFSGSLGRLRKPEGTNLYLITGSDREQGRNEAVKAMLDNGDDWLLFIDDDHIFEEDLLERLLAHDVDVVGALYLRRDMPYTPICYESRLPAGKYVPIDLSQYPKDALVKVDAVGTGGMLVRREVFEWMDPADGRWFLRGEMTEDIIFCASLRDKFDIYCDLGTRMGHMTTTAIWPSEGEHGEWAVSFNISGQVNFITSMP